ncbi:uncharacterized protein LOC111277254 [Durio zibethinus]|uniref:Uncharacterized protein LOC111277254 n=1 Tax=Durio zibethinus TaxID=66656 RepID=A0A6P5WTB0_DURZI|nr:uncharacterized protein LOC111277254 [Durio zibethinus]
MAWEITELLRTKLNLLCKDMNYSNSKSDQCIKELEKFRDTLKGADDHEENTDKEWEKLVRDIYSLEDIIEPLICRSGTTLKCQEVLRNKMRLTNKIGKLTNKVRKLVTSSLKSSESGAPSNSNDVQVQDEAGHIQSTYSGDIQQLPTSSESGAGIPPISEDNPPGTVTDAEGSQIRMLLPSNSNDVQVQDEAGHIQSTYSGDIHEDGHEEALIPSASDDMCGEAVDYLEEKLVMEGLVNKLAQPVLSSSKLQCLILKADVSSSGKAILLSAVYNAETVKQHFHCRAWINVSKLSEEIQIVNAILEQCNYDKEKDGETRRSLQQRLHDFLVWKRFLIVLYGVQEGFLWDNLQPIFPCSLNGSRVILVTSHSEGSKSFGKASDEWLKPYLVKSSGYLEEDSSFISAKAVVDELIKSIHSRRRLSFLISFVGVVGSGKTTLLRAMYDAEVIKSHFDCCAWVHVPEVFKERDLLTDIWGQVAGDKKDILLPLKSLRQKLRSFLAHKRYLVVLYDLWTAETWECIKISLPNSLNGSRVVLDVQEVDVARRIFKITSCTELLHDLKDMQENASEKGHEAERWESLSDIMDRASVIVGLEDKLRELAKLVLNSYRLHFLVSVSGGAGSGKTTVVRTFYNSIASKQHFECRAWISVPEDFEERGILLDLFRQLRKVTENRSLSVEQLRKGLRLFLTWKRYLIVLDDVRTPVIWNRLNLVFPNSSNGSRVILTIRKAYLAYHMNPQAVVLLRPLDKDESWELFKKELFKEKEKKDIEDIRIPSDLKEKILQRCGGVPLTIVLLGGLLSTKGQNYTKWSEVMEQTNKRSEKKKGMTGKDQLSSSGQVEQKHEKNEAIMANQVGSSNGEEKNSIEGQSSSSVQQVPSDAKGKDNKRKTPEYTTTGDDQLTDPNQVALFATEQTEQKKVVTDIGNATSAEDKSTSSDESSSPAEISLSNTVAVTYQHLSFSSKCCLLYLGLFRRPYKIPVRRLLQLWLAEGLVTQPTGGKNSLEDLAKSCFEELLRTNMIEIAERRLDGSPKTCRVTNTLYDTLLLNAEKAGFFHIHPSSVTSQSPQRNIRRLAEQDMYKDTKPPVFCIQHLRTYISFYDKKGDAPTSGVGELLNKIVKGGVGMLVVLDLEGVYKPVLSEILGKLRQLKYLGLRRTLLDSIPESVGGLSHLETLDIKQTYIITMPSTIWEAKKLQHLYMSEIYVDVSVQKTSACGSLSSLQTLWGLIIRRKIPKTWLDNLTGLRRLKLTYLEASMEVSAANWLSNLSNLESLKLRSISDSNEPAKLDLGGMKNLRNLSRLYLLGQLETSIKVNELPQNLEVLTLSVSNLSEDPMEALGQLPKLKVLRLYAHSFEGQNMICHHDGFPKLLVLKLWMLEELQKWTVVGNAMKNLKELEIRCCKKLTGVDGLENLTSLMELTLTNMEPYPPFVADAEEKIGCKVKIIKTVLEFPPPWK